MSRALNGGAEDAEDMGLLLKHADLVRHETGTAVLFVAHCGKDAAKGIRGWRPTSPPSPKNAIS